MIQFILGYIMGSICTIVVMSLCVVGKRNSEEITEDSKNGKIFDYCRDCYKPIFANDMYVELDDKHYCYNCGHNQFKFNCIHAAEVDNG